MKKIYTSAFKAQIVQELLKETKTLTQLAAEHSVHPNVLRDWKVTVLKGMAGLFEKGDSIETLRTAYEQQLDDRFAQIGRLTTQVAWLKKTVGAIVTFQPSLRPNVPPDRPEMLRDGDARDTA
jgi:transposase-like protein